VLTETCRVKPRSIGVTLRTVEPGATATTVPVLLTVATAALPVRRIAGVRR